MNATATRRRRSAEPQFELIEWTQHYRLINGRWYRDAVARRTADGELRIVAYPDTAAAA
jgi:hypothetical protein